MCWTPPVAGVGSTYLGASTSFTEWSPKTPILELRKTRLKKVWRFAQDGGARIQTNTDLAPTGRERALSPLRPLPLKPLSQPATLPPAPQRAAPLPPMDCVLAPQATTPFLPVFIIYFHLLCFTLLRPGKWTRQMGKEAEILCNTIVCITKLVLSASPRDLLELVRQRWG